MAYHLEGRLLEVCTCNVLCPCWVGEDPDNGTCDGLISWQIDRGTIDGVDVAGHNLTVLAHIPGNILQGNWRVVVYLDDRTTPEQQTALLNVWTGKRGGPVADLVQLVGEVMAVERVPVSVDVHGGTGKLRIGPVEAEMSPFKGATGEASTLHDTIFTTIPGSPAYPGKAAKYYVDAPQHGFTIDLTGHNAVQGTFRFEAA
jgi:hypothetical protein